MAKHRCKSSMFGIAPLRRYPSRVRSVVDKPSGRVCKTTTEGGVVVIGKKRKAKLNRLLHEGKVSTSELSAEDLQNAKKVPGLQWSCEGVMDEAEIRNTSTQVSTTTNSSSLPTLTLMVY
ncbi:hypothetical protein FOZ62_009272 [Perkinsus olseni]|uniref:Uncharacterized protein n=1 Tax=Perkinsus olseni TaxID=32597 RepID=A0A7J6QEC6_PEROL|nr:hypothetical protein FOZ62_009272 [Perkinsus olseni]